MIWNGSGQMAKLLIRCNCRDNMPLSKGRPNISQNIVEYLAFSYFLDHMLLCQISLENSNSFSDG